MHIHIAIALIALIPPLTGIAIILMGRKYPPRLRSTLALGSCFLLNAIALTILGSAAAILDGQQPFIPYWLMTGLPALAVLRMMQLELKPFTPNDLG
jgi:hypothetical protein